MTPEITGRRELDIDRSGVWAVVVFDDGARYMLTCNSGGLQFSAHFDPTQWDRFQELVSP